MSTLKLGHILRNKSKNQFKILTVRWYSDNDKKPEKSESNTEKNEKNDKSKQVLNKLNALLKEITSEPKNTKIPLELSKPTPKYKPKEMPKKPEIEKKENLIESVKNVAESLGGNTKITEAELMKKLLSTDETETVSNLSDIFKGMKIDRSPSQQTTEQHSRSQQVKNILAMAQMQKSRSLNEKRIRRHEMPKRTTALKLDNIDLFGAEPLGIFTNTFSEKVTTTKTWDKLNEYEMKLAVTHPPTNYFQQMILWTEQGKLWKFPIDNEQGLEEEQNVCFTEHIFLEKHLESWCPSKGPIRHFMELVCVGLSKNPYISAETKKEHIDWYRDYFESKKELLKEVGAGNLNEYKQIESK